MKGHLLLMTGLLLFASGGSGCRKEELGPSASRYEMASEVKIVDRIDMDELGGQANNAGERAEPGNDAAQQNKDTKKIVVARKIRYAATIQLITGDFAGAETEISKLVKDARGYIANSDLKTAPGSVRTGFWKARIPVKEFDSFREAVLKLGEVEKNTTDSQDLTEEYHDLENNIKNRQAEEEALRKLMDKATGKMEDFFAVRRELNQVREDIDRKLGRLKLLANLTDMTTVSLTIREKQKYVPEQGPAAQENPTFGMRLGRTLSDSTEALVGFFQAIIIFLAALAPWAPLLLAFAVPTWVYVLRRRRALALQAAKIQPERSPQVG
jgi:hypothetical protein